MRGDTEGGIGTRCRPKGQDYGAARCGLRPLRAVGSIYEPEAIGAGPTPRRKGGIKRGYELYLKWHFTCFF